MKTQVQVVTGTCVTGLLDSPCLASTHNHKYTKREHPKTVQLHSLSMLSRFPSLSACQAHTQTASCSGRSSGQMILELQGHQVSPADIPQLSPLHADSNSVVSKWYPAGGHWLSQVRLRLGHCEVQRGQKDRRDRLDREITGDSL